MYLLYVQAFEGRGWVLPDVVRERVLGCSDPALLTTWIRKAVTAGSLDLVFSEADGA